MVQVRELHVDKLLDKNVDWLASIEDKSVREDLAKLDSVLSPYANKNTSLTFKAREMVVILAELNLERQGLLAALCVPYYDQGVITEEQLLKLCPSDVAKLASTVHQMQSISELQHFRRGKPSDTQIDVVRRMLLAMVEDVRAVLIKLAERICQLRVVKNADEEERVLTAKECSEIYAPLANRLGIGQLKWELEDLAFRFLHPDVYKQIAKQLDEKRTQRETYITQFVDDLQEALKKHDVDAQVYGRPKHIFSIYKKMQKKKLEFDELFDIRAVRIITNSLKDCYAALGVVHTKWRHLASEFDDYVATPKANGYQSIHTVVVGPEQKVVEIQIRSHEMHDDAELGVAAHWMYKEGQVTGKAHGYEEKIAWLRKLLAWHEDMAENEELVQEIRSQVFEDRVYVFTPKGDVIDMPAGSTPLDFAYYIHSQVGHRCIGAKVDGRIVPFTYQLQNAERVEILTQKEPQPKRDWMNPALGYLASSRARSKVHTYFKKHDREQYLAQGRELLEQALAKHNKTLSDVNEAVARFNMTTLDDLLVAVGAGDVRLYQVVNFLTQDPEDEEEALNKLTQKKRAPSKKKSKEGVQVAGIGNLMMNFAKCCQPLPGEPIEGFITQGRGVSVHRKDCEQLMQLLDKHPGRGIDVEWVGKSHQSFSVALNIQALDRPGLLHDITSILSHEKLNVDSVSTDHNDDGQVFVTLMISVRHQDDVQRLIGKIQQVSHVLKVQRQTH
ncbi:MULTISPECIES: GTP diphosphokinase [Gammaproteobacteria]|uniref:GTP diphosphokinase n=1 Tax=Gammaproteobacteria TaxID=1236 RepID=UPI000DD038AE|nr:MULTISPECIES: GTP diphosphokinase [Gammaproteobacteria]RTE87113.1 GTP diphosphokinase [Aliidiomarina sp. B3213]TCZ93099.1 GTP diphosphokinase [Lysobacter sp. N42]